MNFKYIFKKAGPNKWESAFCPSREKGASIIAITVIELAICTA